MYSKHKSVPFTPNELISKIRELQFKLWQHVETRPAYGINTGYVEYLEANIEQLKALQNELRPKVA